MSNEARAQEVDVIDLAELWDAVKRHAILLVAVTVIFALLGFCISKFVMTPQYEASVNMIVNTQNNQNGDSNYVSNDSINSAENLVDSYAIIIKSNRVMKQVIQDLNLDMTVEQLTKCVGVQSINNTQVMKVSVVTPDLNQSGAIVLDISRVAPQYIVNAVKAGSCEVVSDVTRNNDPVSPSVLKNTLAAALIGLILALAYVFLKEYLNNGIVDDADITKQLNLPVLGVIPNVGTDEDKQAKVVDKRLLRKGKEVHRNIEDLHLILDEDEPFNYIEAFNSLRTNINFLSQSDDIKTIMLTSAVPQESKSNTAINLAVALATEGKKVALVDCDLRKPAVHKYLGIPNDREGLTSLLTGSIELSQALVTFEDISITALPCGVIPPNPTEMLGSEKMGAVLRALRSHFDYVILDTPPVSVVTDACVVGKYVDGAILVVRSDFAPRETIQLAKKKLQDVNINVIGATLTQYDTKSAKKSSGYYYAYDYDYYKKD